VSLFKLKFLRRWRLEYTRQRQLEERLRIWRHRKGAAFKRALLIALYLGA
jgi:hypothetical protein